MTETTHQNIENKLALKLADSELQCAQYEALYEETHSQAVELAKQLQKIDAVMSANPELKELFEEAEAAFDQKEVDNEVPSGE
mgnify:FL=1